MSEASSAKKSVVELVGPVVLDQNEDGVFEVPTEQAIKGCTTVGLYFSAHWCPPCRPFGYQFVDAYRTHLAAKNFKVIFISSDRDSEGFMAHFKRMPFYALPYTNEETRNALTALFKLTGVPTLVLLRPDGSVIRNNARMLFVADPTGNHFPWPVETVATLLESARDPRGNVVALPKRGYLGVLFTAHWCRICQTFIPELARFYSELKRVKLALPPGQHSKEEKEKEEEEFGFEIVSISVDQDAEKWEPHRMTMPWLALAPKDHGSPELKERLNIKSVPSFVVLELPSLTVVHHSAVELVRMQDSVKSFPWIKPLPVHVVSKACNARALVLFSEANDPALAAARRAFAQVCSEQWARPAEKRPSPLRFLEAVDGKSAGQELQAMLSKPVAVAVVGLNEGLAFLSDIVETKEVTPERLRVFLQQLEEGVIKQETLQGR